MHIIGLVGGVASGKSFVARELAALGASILDADKAGHDALKLAEVEHAARARWGDAIFDKEERIVRSRLASIVFAPTAEGRAELKFLEQLTHPLIREDLRRQLAELEASGCRVAVLDAPVMLKAGWNKLCDHVVFVDAPRSMRLDRAKARGWSEAEVDAREAAQESIETKRQAADRIIDNSGPPANTHTRILGLWRTLSDSV
jgi:dephospho-CoA kinase